jgi:DNA segregation ATPase FtsK/SpoIIIE-like protein
MSNDRDSFYDDDDEYGYDDDDEVDDEGEEDDGSSRSSSNPFKTENKPGARMPANPPPRTGAPGGNNPSRLPGSVGSNPSSAPGGQRPGGGLPGSGNQQSGQRPGGSPFSSGSGSGGNQQSGQRPGGGSSFGSGSGSSGGSSFGSGNQQSGQRPGGGSSFGSGSGSGSNQQSGQRPGGGSSFGSGSGSSGGSSFGSGGQQSGQRPSGGSSFGSGSSGGSGDRDKDKSSDGGKGGLGGLTSRFGGGGDKDKDKSGGGKGGLGGLTSRFGGGGDKPATPKGDGGKGGLGGLTSRFGGGGDKSGGKSGGLLGGLRGGQKQDDRSSSSSSFGGSRPGGSTPGSSSNAPGRSPLGGTLGGPGGKTATGTFPKTSTGTHAAAKADTKQGFGARLAGSIPFLGGKKDDKRGAPAKPRTSKAPKVQSDGWWTLDRRLDALGIALTVSSLALFFSAISSTKGQLTESVNQLLSKGFGWGALGIVIAMFLVGMWLILRHFGEEAPIIDKTRLLGVVVLYVGGLVVLQYVETFINPQYSNLPLDLLQQILQLYSVEGGRGGGWVGAEIYYFLVSNIGEIGGFFIMIGWVIIGIMLTLELSAAELAIIVTSLGRSFTDARQRRAQSRAAQRAELDAAIPALPQVAVSRPEPEQLPGVAVPALPAATQAQPMPALTAPERNIPVTMGGRTIGAFKGDDMVPVEAGTAPAASVAPAPSAPLDKPAAPQRAGGFASRLRGAVPGIGGNKSEDTPSEKPAARNDIPAINDKPAAPTGGIRGRFFGGGKSAEPEKPALVSPAEEEKQPLPAKESAAFVRPTPEVEKPAATIAPAARPTLSPAPAAASSASSPTLSPTARPPMPAPKPVPVMSPDDDDEDDEFDDELDMFDEDEPVRLGDLIRPAPGAGKPFGRPTSEAAKPPVPTPSAASPVKGPPLSQPTSSPLSPAAKMPPPADDDEDDEMEKLSSLPPARPKGTSPLPRPGDDQRSRFGPTAPQKPATSEPTDKPSLGDRQGRLDAIRSGQVARPEVKPDTDRPEEKQQPAATVQKPPAAAASVVSPTPARVILTPREEAPARPAPTFGKLPDDRPAEKAENKPAAMAPTEKPTAPTTPPLRTSPAFNTPANEPPVRGFVKPADAPPRRKKEWKLPEFKALLMPGSEQDFDRNFLLQRARVIEETLSSFGAPGRVVEVNTGPVITQFGVEPDYQVMRSGKKNRVKVSAIAQLDKDLQLALGARSIRIEAPVPGKGYVGIEVPNEEASLVSLRDVMESEEFERIDSPLTIALGQSVDGTPVAADLSVMPHLLIAGTTGSGKSVCVNAIITSLLLRNQPDKVKLIMVDPKRVELTGYNGIPHLVAPVVVDLERIVGVLKWVTREMDERYKRFSNAGARNIEDFNKHLPANEEWMPYIIVIIDELADLMMLAPDETERVITRIAALARATGIHLVIATQRPSVDVVTGLIKANFPARIAFAVAGGVDSRVILDQPGAERLLGRGDMLYMSGDSPAPVRLQGVFVSDVEINNITRYWKSEIDDDAPARPITMVLDSSVPAESARPVLAEQKRTTQQAFWERENANNRTNGDRDDDDDIGEDDEDEMYEEAVEMVRRLGKASVSLLQRRLRIGYTRAARLIDLMEERGVVGPAESGSKPREVLPVAD